MRTYSRRAVGRKRTQRRTPSLLILRFDAEKLTRDGLYLADETRFVSQATQLIGAHVKLVSTTDSSDLLGKLGELAQTGAHFDLIVAIGHSNDRGIQIASDRFSSWDGLAEFLRPFTPRRLMLIACQAGCQPAAQTLFRLLPPLRRIYASSANVSRDLATFMLGFLLYLTPTKAPTGDVILMAQAAAFAFTRIYVREWRRGVGHEIRVTPFDDLAEIASRLLH